MFIEEARVGSELAHPNIVQVHDFIAQEGSYYLVMEWVEGIDLESGLKGIGALNPFTLQKKAAAIQLEVTPWEKACSPS